MTQPPTASPDEIARLVDQLHDFRTRRNARQRLMRLQATDALLECLENRNEAVVWSAIHSIPYIPQGERAIPKLLELLERGFLPLDVANALQELTGKDCGINPQAWREELDLELSGQQSGFRQTDLSETIEQAGEILGVGPTGEENHYTFDLSLEGGRRQKVYLILGNVDNEGDEVVMVYSPCAPARADYYEQALRLNVRIPAGALGIYERDGQVEFVMVDVLLADGLNHRQLAKSVRNIASRADKLEDQLAGEDVR